jgi:hypothetical protein
MRSALLFVCFLAAASVCAAAAAPSQPAKPFVEPQTGISFPVKLGPLAFKEVTRYRQPGLGLSLRYDAEGDDHCRVDVYIYDLGKKGLGFGVDSDEVKQAFEQAKADIVGMEKAGRYKDVKKVAEKPYALKVGDKDMPMLSACYQYTIVPEAGVTVEFADAVSYIYLTAYKGQFLKVRCTYSATEADKGKGLMEGFLTGLGTAIEKSRSGKPTWTTRLPPAPSAVAEG